MATLIIPRFDPDEPWPTLGPQVCQLIEERMIFGPGSLKGEPAKLDEDARSWIYGLYEVYPQTAGVMAGRRRHKRGGISVRKGLAKCVAPETPVLLADGTEIAARHLLVGDEVVSYTADRELVAAPVVHVEVQHDAPLWRITTERGRTLTVTGHHPFMVRGTRMLPGTPNRRRYPSCDPDRDTERWVDAADLIVGDRLVVGLGWQGTDPLVDTETAWMLGAWTGDGGGDGRFTSADPEILDRLRARFRLTGIGSSGYDFYAQGIRRLLRLHGLYGCNARSKRVPPLVRVAQPAAVLAFMAGYLDTDGWVSHTPRPNGKTHCEIAWGSVNRDLLRQCQTMLAGLGINASLCESRGTYNGEPHLSWNLAVRDTIQTAELAERLLPHMSHPRKAEKLRKLVGRPVGRVFAQRDCDRITRIEPLPAGPSVAIEVAATHTHVTAGLVTHNTERMAWIANAELHPEGPVRCDGFDAYGEPVGRPVRDPYIPLLAVTVEQVEELAYGALMVMCEEGPDADLFDVSLERILRLSDVGRDDGKCVPLSNSPGARDGARTTFQAFDEPHRLFLPRQRQAHETMLNNINKRQLEDPWSLYVGTAGEPGEGSIAEDLDHEAQKVERGQKKPGEAKLFYFKRWAEGDYNLEKQEERVAAIIEATGDTGEWGPGQFDDIASNWTREGADLQYLERVWLNRWVRSNEQAFSPTRRAELELDHDPFVKGELVTIGFDGARFRDSTAIVLTHVDTGVQKLWAMWERMDYNIDPDTGEPEQWEIDEDEVVQSFKDAFKFFQVWRANLDPPHWTDTANMLAGIHEQVELWYTARTKPMALAVRAYKEAMDSASVGFAKDEREFFSRGGKTETYDEAFARHCAAAGRNTLNLFDDDGKQLFTLRKLHGTRKFDAQMAAILSWEARLAALAKGAKKTRRRGRVKRLR